MSLSPKTVAQLEEALRQVDAKCIEISAPPLSCTVLTNEGDVTPVFWETVDANRLQRSGESRVECLRRIRKEASEFEYPDDVRF